MKRKTTSEFIKEASLIHNNKYNYELVNYINNSTHVKIICPIHGEFEQRPASHLKGSECGKCAQIKRNKSKTKTTDIFIKEAKEVHGDKYDYSKTSYKKAREKTTIICRDHGEFKQTPNSHLCGNGCPICGDISTANNKRKGIYYYIKKARKVHGDKYTYNYKYSNVRENIKIICPIHGEFEQILYNHIRGSECPLCSNVSRSINKTKDTEYFIKKAMLTHGKLYDYSNVDYKNIDTPVEIICSKHGIFWQIPSNHYRGSGCQKCSRSKGEIEISKVLNNREIKFIEEHMFDDCKNDGFLRFDFYLPDYNICIEFDGRQHFDSDSWYYSEKLLENDEIKNKYCENNNIKLIRIPYWKFENIEDILNENLEVSSNG